jgi:hypothetical protein
MNALLIVFVLTVHQSHLISVKELDKNTVLLATLTTATTELTPMLAHPTCVLAAMD